MWSTRAYLSLHFTLPLGISSEKPVSRLCKEGSPGCKFTLLIFPLWSSLLAQDHNSKNFPASFVESKQSLEQLLIVINSRLLKGIFPWVGKKPPPMALNQMLKVHRNKERPRVESSESQIT